MATHGPPVSRRMAIIPAINWMIVVTVVFVELLFA